MNNITIDACTGDIVVKSMIQDTMPNLHNSSTLKAVHRILEGYDGPKCPRVSSMEDRCMLPQSGCAMTSSQNERPKVAQMAG
ncbi:unnamed protein product [Ectocarpus sp. 12 AP-2014]